MSTPRIDRLPATVRTLIATSVAATAIGAAGCVALAVPAQGSPPQGSGCTQFGFTGAKPFEANGNPRSGDDGGWRLTFDSVGTKASGPASVFFFNTAERINGHVVSGGIDGRTIDFRIQFDDKPNNFWDFHGTVDDRGTVRGTETLAGGGMPASWSSGFALDCLASTVPPPPGRTPLPYGPNTCAQGFAWREASPSDETCVTPGTRDQTARQNSLAAQNRAPNGGAYGPDTCNDGFVWRDAFSGDHVCVTPAARDQAAADNAAAATHLAANQAAAVVNSRSGGPIDGGANAVPPSPIESILDPIQKPSATTDLAPITRRTPGAPPPVRGG